MHHGGASGQVGAEANAVAVGDSYPGGYHVVQHCRELVDQANLNPVALGGQFGPGEFEVVDLERSKVCPHTVGERPEDSVDVHAVRRYGPVAEHVKTQVGVDGVDGGIGEVSDECRH